MEAVRSKKTKTKPSGKAQVGEKKVFTLVILYLMLKSTCIQEGQISIGKNRLSVGKFWSQPQHDIMPLEKLTVNKQMNEIIRNL